MTSLTLGLDNIEVSENIEHISKLFPKCRPKSDINLNPIASGKEDDEQNNSSNVMNTDSDDDDRWTAESTYNVRENVQNTQVHDKDNAINLGGGGVYKLRDSRIIEIAGGRELFSQSRSKAGRKNRLSNQSLNNDDDGDKKLQQQQQKSPAAIWELRGRNNEGKKTRNFHDFTETIFSSEISSVTHNENITGDESSTTSLNRNYSPTQQQQHQQQIKNAESPPLVSSGEVVVFDDIDEENIWRASAADRVRVSPSSNNIKEHCSDDLNSDYDNIRVTKIIGNLPIAVYEGSPRRYGLRQMETNCTSAPHPQLPSAQSLLASPSVYPPRPGFPQRIVNQVPTTNYNENDNIHMENVYNVHRKMSSTSPSPPPTTSSSSAFDYLYEFSETRKVLEEFFKCPPTDEENHRLQAEFQDLEYELRRQGCTESNSGNSYVGQRLAKDQSDQEVSSLKFSNSPKKSLINQNISSIQGSDTMEMENNFLDLSIGTGSSGDLGETEVGLQVGHSRNFTLSPETTDCDSNCGDLDSEVSLMLMENEVGPSSGLLGSNTDLPSVGDSLRLYSSMPVLEDGLSSGHASDTDNNNPTVILMKKQITEIEREINHGLCKNNISKVANKESSISPIQEPPINSTISLPIDINGCSFEDPLLSHLDTLEKTPPPPAPVPHRLIQNDKSNEVEAAIKDIRLTLQRTKTLPVNCHLEEDVEEHAISPIWVPSYSRQMSTASGDSDRKGNSGEEEENDTDLETDRLLGQQRTDDQGFFDEKDWNKSKSRTIMSSLNLLNSKQILMDENTIPLLPNKNAIPKSESSSPAAVSDKSQSPQCQKGSISSNKTKKEKEKKKGRNKEDVIQRSVLIEGVLFRARYLGSTQLVCEGQPTKTTRMMQAEEAVSRIKALAPDGESQPSTEVDLFISTEKIMVLNTDLKEIMMDHALRTISYIADIGDLVVLMARRRFVPHELDDAPKINRTPKMVCHVFESDEAQFIAQSIGQAFQVAYMEFLKANGIEDHSFVKEMDYQEVLNSQEIFGDELQMFAKKEMQKEVVVPKTKGEILGVVIVESGWGSMLPTVVIANLAPAGAAARCGMLNIGDQIIAINGVSLVGLPLSTCQNYIKNTKNQTVVKLTVVPCAPVVEVKIKRPDTKYQLGFSVQNGVICSLLRGGIAERGGVRVGHRIIEINNQSVVAVPHEKIVNLLATSVGEILMKTMPTSMFRLLTGQENPVYI